MNKPLLREKIKELLPLYECSGCTDPQSEGTHQGFSKQHFEEMYADEFEHLFEETLKECLGEKELQDSSLGLKECHRICDRNELRDEVLARFEEMKK